MAVVYKDLEKMESVKNTDTFEEWRKKTNAMIVHTEAAKDNIGDLALLNTSDKFSIVNSINEVHNEADTNTQSIGNLALLESDISAVDLVTAINNNYSWQKTNTDTQIDKEVIDRKAADLAIQSELDISQVAIGISTNGTFPLMTGASYVGASTSLWNAVTTLDIAVKSKADLLDTLIDTLGAQADAKFNWSDSTINYLSVETSGYANIKKNLVILDNRIKTNTDGRIASSTSTEQNSQKITNIITTLGTDSPQGISVVDPRNTYAIETSVRNNIKILDDNILLLNEKIDKDLEVKLNSLQSQIDLRTKIEDVGTVAGLATGLEGTTIVDAINAIYGWLKPMHDDYTNNGGFVRRAKPDGDSMSTGLDINNGDLNIQGSDGRVITCSGDIVAYIGSVG